MSAARNRGKSLERQVAKLYGGVRMGATGKADPDVVTDSLVIECKRVTRPGIQNAWIEQAQAAGKRFGKPWLLVRRITGSPRGVVVMDEKLALHLLREAGMVPARALNEQQEAVDGG